MSNIDQLNHHMTSPQAANFVPLSPLSFIKRTAQVFGDRTATIYNEKKQSWRTLYQRCCAFADAIHRHGLERGDVVSVLAFNTPEMIELQFSVAMAGGVLNTINTRLDPQTIAGIIDHAEPIALVFDAELSDVVADTLSRCNHQPTHMIVIHAPDFALPDQLRGGIDYDDFVKSGDPAARWSLPASEWDAFGLNYTSGTGGRPKGVVINHRGAYLMAMGTVPAWNVPMHPTYLYTVPLFHCNGWGHAWMNALVAGTMICLKKIEAVTIFDDISRYRVTHFGGAPVVLSLLINAPSEQKNKFDHVVHVMTAGAPPPPAILEQAEQLGFEVMQVYGLTETYGHIMHCAWNANWDALGFSERAEIKARQGVQFTHTEEVEVIDLDRGDPVPWDGLSEGEIVIRSNTVMKGYHKDPLATHEAFKDGFFRSGDLAVRHSDGYIEIKDRLKDVIISGGENISSVEVENILYRIPGVACAAVVAKEHEKWGEVPVGFIELSADSAPLNEATVIQFCREHLAGFKTPKQIVFKEIPKTSTGKVQKFILRDELKMIS